MKWVFKILVIIISCTDIYSQWSWTELNTGVSVQLNSASSLSVGWQNDPVWACGYNGTVIRSTNSGQNWQNVSGNGLPNNITLFNIFIIDANTALTAGNINAYTFVFKTTTGGSNWFQVFEQANGHINAIWMTSIFNGLMVGNPIDGGRWSLWKTSDAGVTWDSTALFLQPSGYEIGFNNSLFSRQSEFWFGANNNRIYYSFNYGANWVAVITPEPNIYAIWFSYPYGTLGYAGGSSLLKTTSTGWSWDTVNSAGIGTFGGITGSCPPYIVWYVRSDNKIYRGYPGWNNWVVEYTAASGIYKFITEDRNSCGSGNVYAVKSNGGITRSYYLFEGIKVLSSNIPENFSLPQNYPNPFNPVTKIKFAIPLSRGVSAGRGVLVSLVIYDVLGREIATLVNEQLSPGTYEAEWDGSNFASGVFFYKLTTSDYTETKKMVLIK
jgi:photosystem II stability/assembly factor-like uncharacterized protein